jgi:hypothetical protein
MSTVPSADPVPGRPDPARPLLFTHIPRTAGSTLKFVLRSTLGHQRTLLDAHFYDLDGEDLHGFALVEGHLDVAFFAEHFGAGWQVNGMTMLREPAARTISQARHIRARPGPFQEHLRARVHDPESVFERVPRLANLQTKYLSGTPRDATTVDAAALTEAKANLERLAFGVTEQFDTSMALLMERLRFGIPKFDVVNVSRGVRDDDLLSDDFRAAARRHNDLDLQLYKHGCELLRARVKSFTEALLAAPADEKPLDGILRFRRQRIEDHIGLPGASVAAARFSGWLLIDGRPVDAAFVRVDDELIPLVPRIERSDAARGTHDLHNRAAGVVGTLRVPPEARCLELLAFDRARGLRARRTIEIRRVDPPPLSSRLPSAIKNRVGKLLGR